jgi:HPt (histidine-containing phosphotransfer) domain-containing protein
MSDTAEPLLDDEVLAELQAVLGDGLHGVLVTSITHFASTIAECDALAEAGDLSSLRRVVHRLKGGASSIGALRLTTAARRLEAACKEERLDDVAVCLTALRAVGAATIAVLAQHQR